MSIIKCLPDSFYQRPVLVVARDLLGKKLIRIWEGIRLGGMINEVEAYDGEEDQACHARSGKTARNSVMYGPPGRAYVYFTYGLHWMLNCVCGKTGYPAAVLIRGLIPLEGIEKIAENRKGIRPADWCNGPAKLTNALRITKDLNNADITDPQGTLIIEDFENIDDGSVKRTPRIGIQYASEPWVSNPWRFLIINENQAISKGLE